MAIAFVGNTQAGGGVLNGANVTLNLNAPGVGSAPSVGDIVLIVSSTFGRAGNEGRIGNALSYTQIADLTGGTQRIRVAWKAFAAGENSVTIEGSGNGSDGMAGFAIWFSGVDASPFSVTSTTNTGTTGSPDPAAITPAHDDCMIVCLGGVNANDNDPGTQTNYTVVIGAAANDANDSGAAGSRRLLSGGSGVSEDPPVYVGWASTGWGVLTAALKAADTLMGQAML
jgi:hypothetical protein